MHLRRAIVSLFALLGACGAVDLTAKEKTPAEPTSGAIVGTDQDGNRFDLADVGAAKATVVIFYRGHW